MSYSSAYFDGQSLDLQEAQLNKIRRILDLSELKKGNRILEIGSGWAPWPLKLLIESVL